MKYFKYILLSLLIMSSSRQAFAWGFWAHQRINRMAIFTLPPDMLKFYKKNIEYLTDHAVDPDKRRYAVDGEAPRHYIDVDHYGEYPFPMIPRKWKNAVSVLTEDTLQAYGIVPWHIQKEYYRLVDAFRNKDTRRILKISADIGHYIGDSNVPLHTTENYNGQFTGQKGIHGLWESRLPELYGLRYNFFLGQAEYVPDVLDEAWQTVLESHLCLDSTLGIEKKLTEYMPSDQKYSFESRGNVNMKVYSREFCKNYHNLLQGMVERRMRKSIQRVGAIWYTAWVDAGQPDLRPLLDSEVINQPEKYEEKLKIIDREAVGAGATGFIHHHDHNSGRREPCQMEEFSTATLAVMIMEKALWKKWGEG